MVTVRKSRSVCSFVLVNVAGVEGPWVPLMVGDTIVTRTPQE
jgi:hypothetical protein